MRIRKGFKTHLMKTDAKYVNTSYIADRLDANYYSDKYLVIEQQIKNSGYKVVKYHDICDVIKCGPFGSSVLAENYNDTGIIMIRPLNLKEVLLSEDELVRFPEESLGTDFPVFEAGDILFARVGTPSCSIIPNSIEKVTISPNIIASKLKKTINKYYVALFLNTDYGLNQLERRFKAVSQPTISTDEIKTIDIVLPDVHIQNYIGNKLRKAEELREEAKLLSEKAKKLVINKLGDIPQKITEKEKWGYIKTDTLSSSRLDANYYSGVYLEIEKLLKNRTKSFSTLSSLCKRISQGYNKNNYGTCNNAFAIGIGDFGDLSPIKNEEKKVGFPTEKTLQKFDIIWCSTAHLQKYIGEKINIVMEPDVFVPTPEITFIRPDISKINPYYLFIFMQTEWGYYQIQRTVKGLVPRSYPEDIKEIIIPLIEFTDEELSVLQDGVEKVYKNYLLSKTLIKEAKQDVEDLIEGKFNESKVSEGV